MSYTHNTNRTIVHDTRYLLYTMKAPVRKTYFRAAAIPKFVDKFDYDHLREHINSVGKKKYQVTTELAQILASKLSDTPVLIEHQKHSGAVGKVLKYDISHYDKTNGDALWSLLEIDNDDVAEMLRNGYLNEVSVGHMQDNSNLQNSYISEISLVHKGAREHTSLIEVDDPEQKQEQTNHLCTMIKASADDNNCFYITTESIEASFTEINMEETQTTEESVAIPETTFEREPNEDQDVYLMRKLENGVSLEKDENLILAKLLLKKEKKTRELEDASKKLKEDYQNAIHEMQQVKNMQHAVIMPLLAKNKEQNPTMVTATSGAQIVDDIVNNNVAPLFQNSPYQRELAEAHRASIAPSPPPPQQQRQEEPVYMSKVDKLRAEIEEHELILKLRKLKEEKAGYSKKKTQQPSLSQQMQQLRRGGDADMDYEEEKVSKQRRRQQQYESEEEQEQDEEDNDDEESAYYRQQPPKKMRTGTTRNDRPNVVNHGRTEMIEASASGGPSSRIRASLDDLLEKEEYAQNRSNAREISGRIQQRYPLQGKFTYALTDKSPRPHQSSPF